VSSLYTGNPAGGAWTPAIQITEPSDTTDLINAASVNTALSHLADVVAFLQQQAAQLGGSNTFAAAQNFSALLTLTNNISLTAAVAQSILKTAAGGLTFGTAAGGGDLTLSANGTALLKLLASGSMDAQGKVLGNLATPGAGGDAATKGYVDGKFPALAWTALTITAPHSAGVGYDAPAYFKDAAGIVHLRGSVTLGSGSSGSQICAIPSGVRPLVAAGRSWLCAKYGSNVGIALLLGSGDALLAAAANSNGEVLYLDAISYPAER